MSSVKVNVVLSPFQKNIEVPSSKSYSNRLLILACIHPSPITIENISNASDVDNLINCLQAIGLKIIRDHRTVLVNNSFPSCESPTCLQDSVNLYTGDGGTTNRFLLAMLTRGRGKYRVHASGSMARRPMAELYNLLCRYKVKINFEDRDDRWEENFFPVELQGPAEFHKKRIEVDCSHSSQFISAMKLAYSDTPLEFIASNLKTSQNHYSLTHNLIKSFQYETSGGNYAFTVPVDYVSLSYPAALALFCGPAIINNCEFIDMLAPEAVFFDWAKRMGGRYKIVEKGGLLIENAGEGGGRSNSSGRNGLRGIEMDLANALDLFPTMAFIAAYADSPSYFCNLSNLKYKESNRLHEVCKILSQFSVEYSLDEKRDVMTIYGRAPKASAQNVFPPDDHRMVMMGYLFLRKNSGGTLLNGQAVDKSFPNFFKTME